MAQLPHTKEKNTQADAQDPETSKHKTFPPEKQRPPIPQDLSLILQLPYRVTVAISCNLLSSLLTQGNQDDSLMPCWGIADALRRSLRPGESMTAPARMYNTLAVR